MPELSEVQCGAPALGIMDRGSVDDDVSPHFEECIPPSPFSFPPSTLA